MKKVVILGSTGSIGRSAVEIAERSGGDFEIIGLAAGQNIDLLEKQLDLFPGARFSLGDESALSRLVSRNGSLSDRCAGTGNDGMRELITGAGPDLVINALVGISGLLPTITALESGCELALANKESLVTAGELISSMKEGMQRIIPVDSEHFSLSRCLCGNEEGTEEIILTASGGPFFGRKISSLSGVTVDEVLDHPTWNMGKKVTVDSALLLNKGLEVIEAHWLFGFPYDRIKVIIHPQSIVHSLVRMKDGSLLAHLGPADMRLPILSSMYHPRIVDYPWKSLGLEELGSLEFIPLDPEEYPAFRLALQAAKSGGTAPTVLNAADEVAVEAFLSGRTGFLSIIDWIDEALSAHESSKVTSVDDLLEADRWARDFLAERHKEAIGS